VSRSVGERESALQVNVALDTQILGALHQLEKELKLVKGEDQENDKDI
jgi:hypothetical protein